MKKRLFIHIGTPKTGTTYLQHFLIQNQEKLKNSGIYYPMELNRRYYVPSCNMHVAIIPPITEKRVKWLDPAYNYLNESPIIDLIDDINKTGVNTNIISTEVLYDVFTKNHMEKLKSFFCQFDTFIIVYLRRQDKFLLSMFQEACKGGVYSQFNIDKVLEKNYRRCSYYQKLTQWSDIFGKDHMIVRPFEKKQFFKGNLAKDFINCLGFGLIKDLDYHVESNNKSLSLEKTIYLMALNKNLTSVLDDADRTIKDRDQEIRNKVIYSSETLQGGNIEDLLIEKRRKMILSLFNLENRNVAKKFLGKKNGQLFLNYEC